MTILLADSGSTKTQWCLYNQNNWLPSFETIGLNPYFWESDAILGELQLNVVGKMNALPDKIFFYGSGCSTKKNVEKMKMAFLQAFQIPATHIEVQHDLLAAARALCLQDAGIACIAGTGTNACVYDGSKITNQPINVGFWLGDEGGGGFLGKTLVMKFLHQEMSKDLREKFQETYQISLITILENAYQKPYPNRYFASFAPFLSQNIQDNFCQQLVWDSFEQFLLKYVKKMPESSYLPVHFVGSVAYFFQEILLEVLKKHDFQTGRILKEPLENLKRFHTPD